MSEARAAELGLEPRARIITAATWGNEPEYMGVAPIGATRKALERAGMSIGDVDVYELNEAFAAQVIPIAEAVGFDYDKLNPHGGAIALGHPFGMTGVRIMTTLLNDLETLDGTIGLETMCVAGGQGEAMIVERLADPGVALGATRAGRRRNRSAPVRSKIFSSLDLALLKRTRASSPHSVSPVEAPLIENEITHSAR